MGGRAATCGEWASGDKCLAEGAVEGEGMTTGGVSPRVGDGDADDDEGDGEEGGCRGWSCDSADIMACRWLGKHSRLLLDEAGWPRHGARNSEE